MFYAPVGSTESIKVWANGHLDNQRHRELLNAASYVFEYYFTNNRMPKHLVETGYGVKARIPVDSPVADEPVELQSARFRGPFPAEFYLTIGSGETNGRCASPTMLIAGRPTSSIPIDLLSSTNAVQVLK